MTARVLAALELHAEAPVADLFDLVAGTSAGALVALSLLRPGPGGRPVRSALEVAEFYEHTSRQVFRRNSWERISSGEGYLRPMYRAARLERLLRAELGQTMLSESLCDVLVTSYDLRQREPYFFKSYGVASGRQADQAMWRVARSTSAAPTYFSPFEIHDAGVDRCLVDGGTYCNNPAMCAYADARKRQKREALEGDAGEAEDIFMVSIGGGAISTDLATAAVVRGGKAAWAAPLFDVVLDGQEDSTHYQMSQVMPEDRYFRFQADLPEPRSPGDPRVNEIDNADPRNIDALRAAAAALVESRSEELRHVSYLLEAGRPR